MKYLNAQGILPDALVKECKLMFKADISMSLSNRNSKSVGEKFPVIGRN